MLINKSSLFNNPLTCIDTSNLKSQLNKLGLQINQLTLLQEKQTLPSFINKSAKIKEINLLKNEINNRITNLDTQIKSFSKYNLCNQLTINFNNYFQNELKKYVIVFRDTQQSFLSKSIINENIDLSVEISGQQSYYATKDIILQLTTLLMELKLAITLQGSKLDRIEYNLVSFNSNIRSTTNELHVLPKRGVYLKNKIVFFLLFCTVILMVLTLVKFRKSRNK